MYPCALAWRLLVATGERGVDGEALFPPECGLEAAPLDPNSPSALMPIDAFRPRFLIELNDAFFFTTFTLAAELDELSDMKLAESRSRGDRGVFEALASA